MLDIYTTYNSLICTIQLTQVIRIHRLIWIWAPFQHVKLDLSKFSKSLVRCLLPRHNLYTHLLQLWHLTSNYLIFISHSSNAINHLITIPPPSWWILNSNSRPFFIILYLCTQQCRSVSKEIQTLRMTKLIEFLLLKINFFRICTCVTFMTFAHIEPIFHFHRNFRVGDTGFCFHWKMRIR